MNIPLFILCGLMSTLISGLVTNWVYDLLKPTIFVNRPSIKRFLIIIMSSLTLFSLFVLMNIGSQNSEEPPSVKVQNCMKFHNLSRAHDVLVVKEYVNMVFRFCDWPPPTYADPDGYSQITIQSVGTTEWSRGFSMAEMVAPMADRFQSNCSRLKIGYTYDNQGIYGHSYPFEIDTGGVFHIDDVYRVGDGEITPTSRKDRDGIPLYSNGFLGFIPERNETVVLRNSEYPDSVECVQ